MTTPNEFHYICAVIANDPTSNPYAKSYARAGLTLNDPEAIRVQALYILVNIPNWRAPNASEIRGQLKLISKDKSHLKGGK
jgi:hypothetical protein